MEALTSVYAILTQPIFWALAGLLGLLLLWLAWQRRLRWWPAWVLRAALAGLVLIAVFGHQGEFIHRPVPGREVLVVDQSDSLTEDARVQIRLQAQAWQSAGDNRVVVAYGSEPQAVLEADQVWPDLDGRASSLEDALRLAGDLLGDAPGRVILASDGRVTGPAGVEAEIAGLAGQGHTLDAVQLQERVDPNDGAVGALAAPGNIWAGTPFDVILPVFPPQNGGQARLQVKVDGQDQPISAEPVDQGSYRVRIPARPQGITTLEVTAVFGDAQVSPDPFPANNSAHTTLQVFAAPKVLFVTAEPGSGPVIGFINALTQNNLQADVITPDGIPTGLEALQSYRVIFLHNLLSNQLSQEQILSLQVFVSRLSGGLVFLGGRNSYTLGGYKDTLLEPMLPVKLEPPPRSERPPIVFLLVLDRSSSMGTNRVEGAPRPIVLAREAAMRAIETMLPQDYLGVLTFTDDFSWDVPVRQLGEGLTLREALDAVSRVEASGGTAMYQAMWEGLIGIQGLPPEAPPSRHILVLSDGQSADGSPDEFRALAQAAQDQGITVSTIAFGQGADTEVMAMIAEAGKGRFYEVSQADELPRILIYESQAARSENVQAGETSLKLGEAEHPILSGMSLSQLPLLNGYNALGSRKDEGAEDVLVSSSFGDPILSTWQFGLGRVVAWTGDLGEEWSGSWPSEASQGLFWSQVVRYALVNPALGPAQVNVQVTDTRLAVEAAIFNSSGEPVNLAQVSFTYADPSGQTHSFALPQTSAGLYRLEIPRPPEGSYRAIIKYTDPAGRQVEVPAPFAVNPPEEWMPGDPAAGPASLAAWTALGGGQVGPLDLTASQAEQERTAEDVPAAPRDWWWRLLLALVILWPLEIALRRRWLPWM